LYMVTEKLSWRVAKPGVVLPLLIVMLKLAGPVSAQQSTVEIFKTEQAFLGNKPSTVLQIQDGIKSIRVTAKQNLVINTSEGIQRFQYNTLYGYRIGSKLYRAFGKKSIFHFYGYYEIIDTAGLVLYERKIHHRKGGPRINYFFSRDIASPIRMLTLHELRKAYGDQPDFIRSAKALFQNDFQSVASRDRSGRAKLNNTFLETVNKDL
jgi:heavy metal efflux system protein